MLNLFSHFESRFRFSLNFRTYERSFPTAKATEEIGILSQEREGREKIIKKYFIYTFSWFSWNSILSNEKLFSHRFAVLSRISFQFCQISAEINLHLSSTTTQSFTIFYFCNSSFSLRDYATWSVYLSTAMQLYPIRRVWRFRSYYTNSTHEKKIPFWYYFHSREKILFEFPHCDIHQAKSSRRMSCLGFSADGKCVHKALVVVEFSLN